MKNIHGEIKFLKPIIPFIRHLTKATMKIPDYADPRFSVLRAASHANLPPTFIQIAGHDPLGDEAIVYGEVLAMNGVLVKTEMFVSPTNAPFSQLMLCHQISRNAARV